MTQAIATLYDSTKTFDDNFDNGPFGLTDIEKIIENGEPQYKFLGFPIYTPFGIAAGPLPTSKHIKAAFNLGFDVLCYKTQRSVSTPANPFPNVVPIDITGNLTLEKAKTGVTQADEFDADTTKLTITNSFGNPSRGPEFWVDDLKKALSYQGKGQLLIMSVCGTICENQTQAEYFADFAKAAELAAKASAQAIELNLSCPNVANEGMICYTPAAVKEIVTLSRAAIGNQKLILKFGYFTPEQQQMLEAMLADIAGQFDAIATINTIQAAVYKKDGSQALPGKGRLKSGICGTSVKWAGLDMVKRLDEMRKRRSFEFEIIGVGGVMTPADYQQYRDAGADCVQTATAAMWNPQLAQQIKQSLSRKKS